MQKNRKEDKNEILKDKQRVKRKHEEREKRKEKGDKNRNMRFQMWSKMKFFFEKNKTKKNKRNATKKVFCGEQQKDEQARGKEKRKILIRKEKQRK